MFLCMAWHPYVTYINFARLKAIAVVLVLGVIEYIPEINICKLLCSQYLTLFTINILHVYK